MIFLYVTNLCFSKYRFRSKEIRKIKVTQKNIKKITNLFFRSVDLAKPDAILKGIQPISDGENVISIIFCIILSSYVKIKRLLHFEPKEIRKEMQKKILKRYRNTNLVFFEM